MNTAALLYSFGIHNYAHYGLIKNSLVKSIIQQLLSSLNMCIILPIVEYIIFPPVSQELAFLGIQVKEDVTPDLEELGAVEALSTICQSVLRFPVMCASLPPLD